MKKITSKATIELHDNTRTGNKVTYIDRAVYLDDQGDSFIKYDKKVLPVRLLDSGFYKAVLPRWKN